MPVRNPTEPERDAPTKLRAEHLKASFQRRGPSSHTLVLMLLLFLLAGALGVYWFAGRDEPPCRPTICMKKVRARGSSLDVVDAIVSTRFEAPSVTKAL